jgi:hypothetical protein
VSLAVVRNSPVKFCDAPTEAGDLTRGRFVVEQAVIRTECIHISLQYSELFCQPLTFGRPTHLTHMRLNT